MAINPCKIKKMKTTIVLTIALAIMIISACKKNGELQIEKDVIQISASSYWADETGLATLMWNDTLLLDSMGKTKDRIGQKVVEKAAGQQRLQLKNRKTGERLIDTLLDIPGHFLSFTILQLEKTGKPQLLINKKGEATSPDKRQMGFSYSDPQLPEKLTLELYRVTMINAITPGAGMDVPVAVFENLQRGRFTGFTTINYYPGFDMNARMVFKLKDAVTNAYLPNADQIDPAKYQKGGRMFLNAGALKDVGTIIFDITRNTAGSPVKYNSNQLAGF